MNDLKKLAAAATIIVGVLGTAAAALGNAQALAEAQPFALKSEVNRQLASASAVQNVTRMDLLEFQLTTLKNQRATLRGQLRIDPNNDDIADRVKDTEDAVTKKQRELDLLDCLVKQRNPCVQ